MGLPIFYSPQTSLPNSPEPTDQDDITWDQQTVEIKYVYYSSQFVMPELAYVERTRSTVSATSTLQGLYNTINASPICRQLREGHGYTVPFNVFRVEYKIDIDGVCQMFLPNDEPATETWRQADIERYQSRNATGDPGQVPAIVVIFVD